MKKFIGKIFFIAQVFFVVCLLLALIAPYVPPVQLGVLAFFGLGFPIICILLFVLFFVHLFRLGKKTFWVYVILIAISTPQILNFIQLSIPADEKDLSATKLKVLSYNVRLLGYYEKIENKQQIRRNIIRYIHSSNADVICLQEFYKNYLGDFNTLDTLKSLGYPYFHEFYTGSAKGQKFGLITLSKYPITDQQNISFGATEHNAAAKSAILVEGKSINVYNFHIGSIRLQHDDYKLFDENPSEFLPKKGGQKVLKRLYDAFKRRNNQVHTLKSIIDKDKNAKIIMGDLNDSPNSYAYHHLSDEHADAFIQKGFGVSNTYNGKIPSYRIDYILFDDLKCIDYQKDKVGYSDHFPIQAKFTWE